MMTAVAPQLHRIRDTASWRSATASSRLLILPVLVLLLLGQVGPALAGQENRQAWPVAGAYWVPTRTTSYDRWEQSATLLANGQVLVAGGVSTDPSSAELYNPRTGTWTVTGFMRTVRKLHTATLLKDGSVLVAGGWNEITEQPQSEAEIYDPVSGVWHVTRPMAAARDHQTATLLPSGQVLVAGGDSLRAVAATAELFQPITRTWIRAGHMSQPRVDHQALLLPDGRVLVAGGWDGQGSFYSGLSSADLFDQDTRTWTSTGAMTQGRDAFVAVLLPTGKVLVAGGCCDANLDVLASVELYDPATGEWAPTGSMVQARDWASVSLLSDGLVLVAGGWDGSNVLNSAELYDPATGTWSITGPMAFPRWFFTTTKLPNGRVLAVGSAGTSAELYIPPSRRTAPLA